MSEGNTCYETPASNQHARQLPTECDKFSPGLAPGTTNGGEKNWNMEQIIKNTP